MFRATTLAPPARNGNARPETARPEAARPEAPTRPDTPDRGVDHGKLEHAARLILEAVGEDPTREGLLDTPRRIARMYEDMFSGLRADPQEAVRTVFSERYDEVVLVRDIDFASMCEHHLLPFIGRAHVAYIPDGKVLGLSKLARAVEVYARRPQVQERLTSQVADLVEAAVRPSGVAVILDATHTCMTIRGVRKPGSSTITTATRGVLRTDPARRAEILSLLGGKS